MFLFRGSHVSICVHGRVVEVVVVGGRHPSLSSIGKSPMALASDVAPLLSKERADEPDGLWATKQYGDLKVL